MTTHRGDFNMAAASKIVHDEEDKNINMIIKVEKVLDYMLFIMALIYIVICPFTKVEESFNLQV